MGVSGCGKSTITNIIADRISAFAKDADELHPPLNIEKMAAGIPLTDEDRQPWLETVARYAQQKAGENGICILACSALRRCYRQTLSTKGRVVFLYLHGSHELIAARMQRRTGHFMPATLLDSQFATLEDPRNEPNVLTVSAAPPPATIADNAIQLLEQQRYL